MVLRVGGILVVLTGTETPELGIRSDTDEQGARGVLGETPTHFAHYPCIRAARDDDRLGVPDNRHDHTIDQPSAGVRLQGTECPGRIAHDNQHGTSRGGPDAGQIITESRGLPVTH